MVNVKMVLEQRPGLYNKWIEKQDFVCLGEYERLKVLFILEIKNKRVVNYTCEEASRNLINKLLLEK